MDFNNSSFGQQWLWYDASVKEPNPDAFKLSPYLRNLYNYLAYWTRYVWQRNFHFSSKILEKSRILTYIGAFLLQTDYRKNCTQCKYSLSNTAWLERTEQIFSIHYIILSTMYQINWKWALVLTIMYDYRFKQLNK